MSILKKEELNNHLHDYYKEHYGELDTDIWHDQPAVNVWVFQREQKIISLKSHILTGEVTEYVEDLKVL